MEVKSNPERISNLRKYVYDYDWSRLEFPVAIKGIREFEKKNKLGLKGKKDLHM